MPARKLSKRETESFIEEVWAGKDRDDASRANPRALHEYLHQHLREKLAGDHTAVVEFGYNLCAALRKYDYDADVEMFRGSVRSAVRTRPRRSRQHDRQPARPPVRRGWAPESDRPRRTRGGARGILPGEIRIGPRRARQGRRKDQPDGEFVDFARLFAEDNNKDQGAFATAMYAQHWREIQAYAEGVDRRRAAAGAAREDPRRCRRCGRSSGRRTSKAGGDVDAP